MRNINFCPLSAVEGGFYHHSLKTQTDKLSIQAPLTSNQVQAPFFRSPRCLGYPVALVTDVTDRRQGGVTSPFQLPASCRGKGRLGGLQTTETWASNRQTRNTSPLPPTKQSDGRDSQSNSEKSPKLGRGQKKRLQGGAYKLLGKPQETAPWDSDPTAFEDRHPSVWRGRGV